MGLRKMPGLWTPICDLLGIEYPILQAGMGWDRNGATTPPELVAAVSNAGGLGVIGGSPLRPEMIKERIAQVRALTDRPFGVNITWPRMSDGTANDDEANRRALRENHPEHLRFIEKLTEEFDLPAIPRDESFWTKTPEIMQQQLDVILEQRVPILSLALGDASEIVPQAHAAGIKVLASAGSRRHAVRYAESGVDVIVAQGYDAGGHTGRVANFSLLPQVVDAVRPIPVVAAGGIYDGRGVAAALALGALGVWCGTVFLLSEECNIHPEHRNQLVTGRSEDFVLDSYPTGKPSRHFRSGMIRAWEQSGLPPLDMPFQGMLTDELMARAEAGNKVGLVSIPGGQIAGLLDADSIRPARSIVEDMVAGASALLERMSADYVKDQPVASVHE